MRSHPLKIQENTMSSRPFSVRTIVCAVAAALVLPSVESAAETPNVVLVFADDQGYQDLGCYGSPNIKTPNIDSLAETGMRFTSFYSAYCVCSASRASLMTGCYQPRLSMPGVLGPRGNVGLHPNEMTIADMLKTKGYATMCIGKWHLGDRPEVLPTAQGFDHYFGLPYSNDMARISGWGNGPDDLDKIWKLKKWDIYQNHLYRDEERIEGPVNQVTLTDRYTEEALEFITKNKDKPFFLYMPHTMPHVPLFVGDDRFDEDPRKAYKLTIEHVDWSVGQILKTLDDLEIADNTIIIYTSDNGPWLSKNHHGGSALPLRAGKGTTYDGGMRVPGIVRWPGHVPAGTETEEVAASIDILPTLAEITGAKLPDHQIDGLSLLSLWKDPKSPSPHREVGYFYYKNGRVEAVRMGQWKLRLATRKPPRKNAAAAPTVSAVELYDLGADIGETNNLVAKHPEVVAKLKAVAAEYDAELKANVRPLWRAGE
jgi:arylsulfatase A